MFCSVFCLSALGFALWSHIWQINHRFISISLFLYWDFFLRYDPMWWKQVLTVSGERLGNKQDFSTFQADFSFQHKLLWTGAPIFRYKTPWLYLQSVPKHPHNVIKHVWMTFSPIAQPSHKLLISSIEQNGGLWSLVKFTFLTRCNWHGSSTILFNQSISRDVG